MKQIVFFAGDITLSGGTERVCCAVASALAERYADRYSIRVLSVANKNAEPCFELDGRVSRAVLRDSPVKSLVGYAALRRKLVEYLRSNPADIIVDVDSVLDIISLAAKRKKQARIISWDHFDFSESLGTFYRKKLRGLCAPRVDAVVCLTAASRDSYNSHYRLSRPAQLIPNPLPHAGGEYPGESCNVLSVGALTEVKGFERAIEAAREFLPRNPGWSWNIVGEGELREALEGKIREYGLEGRVNLPGFVTDINKYYNEAAIYALTSRSEGMPMVLLEAKAHRLPVCAFDIGGATSELLLNGVNAELVPQGDAHALARSLESLARDAQKRREYSSASLEGCGEFDSQRITEQWRELFDSLA